MTVLLLVAIYKMAQRQFRSDDTSVWVEKFGTGADGAYSTSGSITDSSRTGYAVTSISGTSGGTSATAGSGTGFSVGDIVVIHQTRNGTPGAGKWELNKISSKGSGTDWTMAYNLTESYATTGQVYRVNQYTTVDIQSGHTLTSVAYGGTTGGIIALMASTSISVSGSIVSSGKGYRYGDAGVGSSGANAAYGEGTAGASATSSGTSANGNGGGGGGGGSSFNGAGGGGHANAGSNGGSGASGGTSAGSAELTTMVFGGGGGGCHFDRTRTSGNGRGGSGGGIIILLSPTITITGTIATSGDASTTATDDLSRTTSGGGGAGGSVLIKCVTATLGSSLCTASLGASGGGGTNPGGAGSVGRIHLDYGDTYTGTTSPTLSTRQDDIYKQNTGGSFIYAMLN